MLPPATTEASTRRLRAGDPSQLGRATMLMEGVIDIPSPRPPRLHSPLGASPPTPTPDQTQASPSNCTNCPITFCLHRSHNFFGVARSWHLAATCSTLNVGCVWGCSSDLNFIILPRSTNRSDHVPPTCRPCAAHVPLAFPRRIWSCFAAIRTRPAEVGPSLPDLAGAGPCFSSLPLYAGGARRGQVAAGASQSMSNARGYVHGERCMTCGPTELHRGNPP